MQFRLVEKKTFLEFVPSEGEALRRSLSLPVLFSLEASEGGEDLVEAPINNPAPKLVGVTVHEHDVQCTESDSSPGTASTLRHRTAGRLASTRCGSNASLLTSLADSTRRGSSWFLEEDSDSDGVPEPGNKLGSSSPTHSTVSGSSSTSAGTLQPTQSVGSALHEAKLCKPCAWYWRPGSCTRGTDCLHCHLCADGELSKRRFQNRKLAKLRKRQSKAEARAKNI